MSPIQQMLLGVGAVATKTYVDDVFSTYVYKGNSTNGRAISTGVDMTEGGLVWTKVRDASTYHVLHDTVNTGKFLQSQSTDALITSTTTVTGFSSTGYTLGTDSAVNHSNNTYASWSFRKAPGFFTCLTFTGNSSTTQVISHDLGCIPGMILLKRTDTSGDWQVYHRGVNGGVNPEQYTLELNSASAQQDYTEIWNDTAPTSTNFVAGEWNNVNNATYIVYLFAGGESTAATARSTSFLGGGWNSRIRVGDSNAAVDDLKNWFDQAFTIEYWVKADGLASGSGGGSNAVGVSTMSSSNLTWSFGPNSSGQIRFSYWNGSAETAILPSETIQVGQWYHLAFVHDGSNNCKIFINGTLGKEATISNGASNSGEMSIGKVQSQDFDGQISNFRITHQALYTTSFKPPTEPLTTTSQGATASNVKLLCCNDSSVTSATVKPSGETITAFGSPSSITDSPFDDPAGFVFGENEDQSVIKCGSYVGNGYSSAAGATGPEISLGWEPQYVMIKNVSNTGGWMVVDSMRGIITEDASVDKFFTINTNDSEGATKVCDLTPTGFIINNHGSANTNADGNTYMYMCIRRPDGYVGKPVELGTSVFAMDVGNGSSTIPAFDSTFPVDFAFQKLFAGTGDWQTSGRLIGSNYLVTNDTDAQASYAGGFVWDSNVGWAKSAYNSSYQSWMWKRHAGFDVVTYKGNSVAKADGGHQVPHNLSKVPEMMWVKKRSDTANWAVYHKGLNGGTNPEQYYLKLDSADGEDNTGPASEHWADTAPTATHFTLGSTNRTNNSNGTYIAMLFASVDGISSVGSFTGPDPEATITIDCGFQPRFVMIKCSSHARDWVVFDTVRGIAAGADKKLALNLNTAQITTEDMIDLTSSGFSLPHGSYLDTNWPSRKFIYYAHA